MTKRFVRSTRLERVAIAKIAQTLGENWSDRHRILPIARQFQRSPYDFVAASYDEPPGLTMNILMVRVAQDGGIEINTTAGASKKTREAGLEFGFHYNWLFRRLKETDIKLFQATHRGIQLRRYGSDEETLAHYTTREGMREYRLLATS